MNQSSVSRRWAAPQGSERPGAIAINALLLLGVSYALTLTLPMLRQGLSTLFSAAPTFVAFVKSSFGMLALVGLGAVFVHAGRELFAAVRGLPGEALSRRPAARTRQQPGRRKRRGEPVPEFAFNGYQVAMARQRERPAPHTPYPFSVWAYHDITPQPPFRKVRVPPRAPLAAR